MVNSSRQGKFELESIIKKLKSNAENITYISFDSSCENEIPLIFRAKSPTWKEAIEKYGPGFFIIEINDF